MNDTVYGIFTMAKRNGVAAISMYNLLDNKVPMWWTKGFTPDERNEIVREWCVRHGAMFVQVSGHLPHYKAIDIASTAGYSVVVYETQN